MPGSTSPQVLHDTPTTPWAELPVPLGRCARFHIPTSPSGHSDHPVGRTPRPPRGVPGSTFPQASQDTPSTPWEGFSIPLGWCVALQELHCPLPLGNAAVYCRSCTAHCPHAVRQFIAGIALPTAPGQCGNVLHELHCPLPPGSEAVHCKSCTVHCPQAVRQCIARVALRAAPHQ